MNDDDIETHWTDDEAGFDESDYEEALSGDDGTACDACGSSGASDVGAAETLCVLCYVERYS